RRSASPVEPPRPVFHRFDGLLRLADVAPGEPGGQPLDAGIAPVAPEIVERPVVDWPQRMVRRPYDGREDASAESRLCRRLFAFLEEPHADALPAIALLQNRFAEIEEIGRVEPTRRERLCE